MNNNHQFTTSLSQHLSSLGVKLRSAHFHNTPTRFSKVLHEFTEFNREPNIDNLFVLFPAPKQRQLVTTSGLTFSSLCAHHLMPFFGTISIGYIPHKHVLGLSKFKRIVEQVSKQITVQENLTQQIFSLLQTKLKPTALIINIEAKHTCLLARGAKEPMANFSTIMKSTHFDNSTGDLHTFMHSIQRI